MSRLDIPGLVLYGGTIQPGHLRGRDLTVQDVFEAVGAYNAGRIDADELRAVEEHACPGAGACAGQYTANTMSTALEFLGLSPPGANAVPATHPDKPAVAEAAGRLAVQLVEAGTNPRSIATRAAFENAIASFSATGGSTNAVLHLLAIAAEAGIPLEIDDFDAICARTPILADLRPGGRFVATDLFAAGGLGCGHAATSRAGAAAWRCGDGRRADPRRGRRIGNRDTGTAGDPRGGRAAQARTAGSPCCAATSPRRMRRQARRPRSRLASWTGTGLRFGGGGVRRGS